MSSEASFTSLPMVGLGELKKKWGWFLALGIALVVLGVAALSYPWVVTLVATTFFGWLMIVAGVLQAAHAFGCKRWGGFFLDLLLGILYAVVGFMLVVHPVAGGVELTLLIAMFLIFGGVFRIVAAFSADFQHRWWILLNGVINVLLGAMIWQQWPLSGLWVIGLFVGIDMIFNGWSLIMLAFMAKNVQPAS